MTALDSGPEKVLCVLVLTGILVSCTHMPMTSLAKLAQIDLGSTDPGQLRAAIKLPRAIEPRPHGVALRIGVRLADGHEEFQDFVLREVTDPAEMLALHRELDATTRIFAYRLDSSEAARLTAFRDELKKRDETSGGRGGSITISVQPDACRSGDLSDRPIYVTTYLRTGETGSYVPLLRDVDLRTIKPSQDLAVLLPQCPQPKG
jgi:hypothetical protein